MPGTGIEKDERCVLETEGCIIGAGRCSWDVRRAGSLAAYAKVWVTGGSCLFALRDEDELESEDGAKYVAWNRSFR